MPAWSEKKWENDKKPVIPEEYADIYNALHTLGRVTDAYNLCEKAISVLGGEKGGFFAEKLPDESQRCFIKIKKLSQTPTKYPRNSGKITKQPL